MSLQPNTLFHDRYYLLEMKGRGSYGEVWLAKDQKLDINVALKVYIALDSRGVEELKAEYRTTFGLSHPNLLHANHFDICGDRPYLVMPYCPSSSLDLVGKVDEATLWRIIKDVASGLDYLHEIGVIHHDIKPDNILVNEKGQFVITDFGISVKFRSTLRRNSSREVQKNMTGGAISYMAPEMFTESAESVNATDIWALGATLYELMTGDLPFFGQGGVMQLKGAEVPEIPGDYSDTLKKLVQSCLSKTPWDRPTAKQLLQYANESQTGVLVQEMSPTVLETSPKRKMGKWTFVIATVAVVVIVAILAWPWINDLFKTDVGDESPTQVLDSTFQLKDGRPFVYHGEWNDSLIPDGHGKAIFEDFVYEGDFQDGNMEGYGTLCFEKGSWAGRIYEGYFHDNLIDSGRMVSGSISFQGTFNKMEYWNGIMSNEKGEQFLIKEGEIIDMINNQ